MVFKHYQIACQSSVTLGCSKQGKAEKGFSFLSVLIRFQFVCLGIATTVLSVIIRCCWIIVRGLCSPHTFSYFSSRVNQQHSRALIYIGRRFYTEEEGYRGFYFI